MKTVLVLFALLLLAACSSPTTTDLLENAEHWDSGTNIASHQLQTDSLPGIHYFIQDGFTDLRNFSLSMELKAPAESMGSLCFHTSPENPQNGYRVMIDNSPVGDRARLAKTGSLTAIRNLCYKTIEAGEWFRLDLRVEENHIRIHINGYPVVDYVEPAEPVRSEGLTGRKVSSGMLALSTDMPGPAILIRRMELEKLPDSQRVVCEDEEFTKEITALHSRFYPLVDYHVHIKGALTMEQALERSAELGINYGIAANCGLLFPITNDEQLNAYMESIRGLPIFRAMQAEGREWVDLFSPAAIEQFDYAFTDAMTWTNREGMRMRLWIPEEVEVGDPEDFMDQLVSQIEQVVTEPVAIYVNPTYLPESIADRYDELWTDERIDRIVKALKDNGVALEINSRLLLPGKAVIAKAKAAGVKFAFGTNNTDEQLGRSEYALRMLKEFQLEPGDLFLPGEEGCGITE